MTLNSRHLLMLGQEYCQLNANVDPTNGFYLGMQRTKSRSHFQISLPNPDGTYGIGAMFDFKCVAYSGTHLKNRILSFFHL